MMTTAMKLRVLLLGRKTMTKLDSMLKKQKHFFASIDPYSQIYGFSSSHVWMWDLDHKESWAPNYWFFWTMVWRAPWIFKEIKPVNPKGNQYWISIGNTDAEAETPILWSLDMKYWLIGKILMLGKTEGRKRSRWQRMRYLDGITSSMKMSLS